MAASLNKTLLSFSQYEGGSHGSDLSELFLQRHEVRPHIANDILNILNIYFQNGVISNRCSGRFGAQWSGFNIRTSTLVIVYFGTFLRIMTMEIVLKVSRK
jgi:hypothetical protein